MGGAAGGAADHPLATTADSKWAEWHADEELRYEIRKVGGLGPLSVTRPPPQPTVWVTRPVG